MPLQIKVEPKDIERIDMIFDLITSAAYFNAKNLNFEKEGEGFKFIFPGHCPTDYLCYLDEEYYLSLDRID